MDSRPLPVAPLHLGSSWGGAAEFFRASSLGFDMARCRGDPSRTGRCAHRLGLARGTDRTRLPSTWPNSNIRRTFLEPERFEGKTPEKQDRPIA